MLIKLLLLAAVAFGVWRLWHKIIRVPDAQGGGTAKPRRGSSAARIEDMAQCPVCNTYLAAGSGACGRQDCPRRG